MAQAYREIGQILWIAPRNCEQRPETGFAQSFHSSCPVVDPESTSFKLGVDDGSIFYRAEGAA
jgi:hypothetical protein